MNTPTRFFFYGTLMSGYFRSHALNGLAKPVSNAIARGDMYAVGGSFPALVDGEGVVVGEVWEALDESLVPQIKRILDRIEGYDAANPERSMYLREERQLLQPAVSAYVYVWNQDAMRLSKVPGGDWRAYREDRAWQDCLRRTETSTPAAG